MTADETIKRAIEVEREHKKTYEWLKHIFDEATTFPSEEEFYEQIVFDHLEEIPDYYSRLRKMDLSESVVPLRENIFPAQLADMMRNPQRCIYFIKNKSLGPSIIVDPKTKKPYAPLGAKGLFLKLRAEGIIPEDIEKTLVGYTKSRATIGQDPFELFFRNTPQGMILAYFGDNLAPTGDWNTAVEALASYRNAKWNEILDLTQKLSGVKR